MVAVLVDTSSGWRQDGLSRLPLSVLRAPVRTPSRATASPAIRRRRVAAGALLVGSAVAILIALQAALGGGGGGPLTTAAASRGAPQPAAARAWAVRPGDTLWSIAVAIHPHGDVRPLVDHLSAEVHGQPLVVGEHIALP